MSELVMKQFGSQRPLQVSAAKHLPSCYHPVGCENAAALIFTTTAVIGKLV